jgi:hypothetical protein
MALRGPCYFESTKEITKGRYFVSELSKVARYLRPLSCDSEILKSHGQGVQTFELQAASGLKAASNPSLLDSGWPDEEPGEEKKEGDEEPVEEEQEEESDGAMSVKSSEDSDCVKGSKEG